MPHIVRAQGTVRGETGNYRQTWLQSLTQLLTLFRLAKNLPLSFEVSDLRAQRIQKSVRKTFSPRPKRAPLRLPTTEGETAPTTDQCWYTVLCVLYTLAFWNSSQMFSVSLYTLTSLSQEQFSPSKFPLAATKSLDAETPGSVLKLCFKTCLLEVSRNWGYNAYHICISVMFIQYHFQN